MSILDRSALQDSPLADLHAIAGELSIDGYRRLRRNELIDAILGRQARGGEPLEAEAAEPDGTDDEAIAEELPSPDDDDQAAGRRRRRGRRGGRGRGARDEDEAPPEQEEVSPEEGEVSREARPASREGREGSRGGRGGSRGERESRGGRPEEVEDEVQQASAEEVVEGAVELLPNGSGFLRVNPPDPSDDDVYISAAQVKRCELISGDRISGPRRAPRRSERFASMVRVDTINDRPAGELADSTRFDDLAAAFPAERFRLGSEDATIKAIEWVTPIGQGSRVTIIGPAQAGKTEALRRLAFAFADQENVQLSVALAGVRPEEIPEWASGPAEPAAAVSFAASPDTQAQALEAVVDLARRWASRGGHAVLLIDTLDGLHPLAARKVLAAARNIVDGGSLTIIATASAPIGGETTVIALDPLLAGTGHFPALDLAASWTIRPELLVGEAGAEAIARARADATER
jgi:transcription termination factor Rho